VGGDKVIMGKHHYGNDASIMIGASVRNMDELAKRMKEKENGS